MAETRVIDSEKNIQVMSKFAGEEFDVGNVRTVFAGASKDNMERKEKVILLFGPTGSGKSGLIDCMCNYFYGAKFDGIRYKIADEIFDRGSTPLKSITKYVFNETAMPFRPVIIDTPEIASDSGIPTAAEIAQMLMNFIAQSQHISIDAIGLVLKFDDAQLSTSNEKKIKETIDLFPRRMIPNTIILFSSSDEKRSIPSSIKLLLQHLNLTCNKYYFFNEQFLHVEKENKKVQLEEDSEKYDKRSSWDFTMSELDRFFEHVQRLNQRQITGKDLLFETISTDSQKEYKTGRSPNSFEKDSHFMDSSKTAANERIIPVKLISAETGQNGRTESVTGDRSGTFIKDLNSPKTLVNSPIIKRYMYDPGTMTHKEYIIRMQKERQSKDAVPPLTPIHVAHETLINDVPPENLITKQPLSSDNSALSYRHIRSSPPPEYGTETITVIRKTPDDSNQGHARIVEKRTSTIIDMDPQQTAASQHTKSAVQRQIARRASGGTAEHARNHSSVGSSVDTSGVSAPSISPKQYPPGNIQIHQTEQIVERLEDGILSTRGGAYTNANQRSRYQEPESYVIPPAMKRSRSPIQVRLTMSKKQRSPTVESTTGEPDHSEDMIEKPRALETNIDHYVQSPLRSYGRLVHEEELNDDNFSKSGKKVHLAEEPTTTKQLKAGYYDLPPNDINAESRNRSFVGDQYNRDAGRAVESRMPGFGANERDELLDVRQLNLEEGLAPHPYKSEPRKLTAMKSGNRPDGTRSLKIGKASYATWDWINCCFFLLAPLFIIFIIIAIVITLAVVA